MKASLKFREDQKPLVRAKIPLSILGLPFLSGISAGDSKELCLNLSTFFESGPSIKLSYRPNDSWNPFSLVLKTGIGAFGSPVSTPMAMSAEFSLLGSTNPSFSLQIKPQIGDFSIKKISGSPIGFQAKSLVLGSKIKPPEKDQDEDRDGSETPSENGFFSPEKTNEGFLRRKMIGFPSEINNSGGIERLFADVEVSARSVLPLRNRALLKFRWGIRFPSNMFHEERRENSTAEISLRKIPFLMMNKISIEHVAEDGKESGKIPTAGSVISTGDADVARACLSFQRQLEVLQAENGVLIKAVEELRSEIGAGKLAPATGKKEHRSENKAPEFEGFVGKAKEADANEELKKVY
ncbi:uncharacterized protein LOC143860960 [Tasmannia lanceolata]|uniref:uncharacterized protein LOC143860960 n=1 Tax=Tasmannia lanceolata TaxID=3420 RepID=UPI004062AE3F